ncbi:MAG: succinate dehydrogenase [Anaerolineae bacterium]
MSILEVQEEMAVKTSLIPKAYIWRRLHSLFGLWIVLFLIEHLLTNSQAALLLGGNGKGFVDMVNAIHNLPYLEAIEIFLLGVPILVHGVLGVKYLFTAKSNSFRSDGSKPALKEYGRNHAYTWQRITSWILLVGIIGHVAKFRFIQYPVSVNQGLGSAYFVRLDVDNGLYTVASRLGATLYDAEAIEQQQRALKKHKDQSVQKLIESLSSQKASGFDRQTANMLERAQSYEQKVAWVEALGKRWPRPHQVIAATENFGTASLLSVRDTFKSPIYVGLYTIFVLAAVFHAFNGFWTFLITWGVVLRVASQRAMARFSIALMLLIGFLGLAAIWGTYLLNLKT